MGEDGNEHPLRERVTLPRNVGSRSAESRLWEAKGLGAGATNDGELQ